jgi:uncharacterized protein (TIGR03000 family)
MSLHRAKTTAMLAIGGLLAIVGPSYGQQNSMIFPWQAQDYRQGAYIYRGETFTPPAAVYQGTAGIETSRAFYPGSSDAEQVMMNVTVPASAKVSVQGAATRQTGTMRRFVSPPIAAGHQYSYNVQATWMENGREVSQSRSFAVHPGEVVHVTFTRDAVTVRPEN